MNSLKIEQCKKLLADNENDMLNVERCFRTQYSRASRKLELAFERRLLIEQWEKLTGTPAPEVVAPKQDGGDGRELAHV